LCVTFLYDAHTQFSSGYNILHTDLVESILFLFSYSVTYFVAIQSQFAITSVIVFTSHSCPLK